MILKHINMKNLFSLLTILLITQHIDAQTNYTPTGTWKYINGMDTVEFFLKTDQITAGTKTYPILIGFHKYVKNGVEIENTLPLSNTTYLQNQYSIVMFGIDSAKVRADGHIKDITLHYKRYIILTKVNPTTINVRLTSMEGRGQTGGIGYTLPRNFQLIKQ